MLRSMLLISLLLWPALTIAAVEPVDLPTVLRAAVTARPQVLAARAQAAAAGGAVTEARSRYLPRLTFSENFIWTDEPGNSLFMALNQERNVMADLSYNRIDPDPQRDFITRLTLEQSLFDSDAAYDLGRARKGWAAAQASASWTAEEAAFAAFQAYLGVQQAGASLAWTEASRLQAQEILRVAAERRSAGTGLKSDELRARVFLAEAGRHALSARNDLTLARRRLALSMGRANGEADIAAPLQAEALPETAALPALADRADLRSLALRREAAALVVGKSRAAYLPKVSLAASYALHDEQMPFGNDGRDWSVTAGLNWELFDGMRRSGGAAQALALERATANEMAEAQRQSQYRFDEAFLRAEEARLQAESARQSVTEAEEGQRLLQQRFEAGLAELVDLLGAQSALDRARFDAVAAETQWILALGNTHFQRGDFLATYLPGEEIEP